MSSAERKSSKKKRKISVKAEEKEPKVEPKIEEEDGDRDDKEDDDSDDEEDELVIQYNKDSEAFINLGRNKRCTIRSFKGKVLVDIREFYEKNDELRPGKKGISLSLEQFRTLQSAMKKGLIDKEVDKFD